MTATLPHRSLLVPAGDETPHRAPSSPLTPRRARRARRVVTRPSRPADRAFRPDIEGLRAIAVVAVVVYHAGLALPGGYVGVDVFLVISGFLITKQLTKSVARSGGKALPTFYAHRVRRLLPAASTVVIATVVAFRFWGPPLKVQDVTTDALFTAFSGLNYRLAAIGTDYQHMGAAASPLQHFWSLAVEEQFYVVWPLVVTALLMLGRRIGPRAGTAMLVTLVIAVIGSSSWASATLTAQSAPWAYFSMHTRAWELATGALLALLAPRLGRLPRRLAGLLAWAGLVAICVAAVRFTDATPFPGTAAWLPVAGAAAVIAAGCGPRVGAERLLAEPLMQCLGRVSYSWYLWHWPMLVIAPYAVGRLLGPWERGAVVWLSLVVAVASFVWVEQPVRLITWPTWGWIGTGGLISAAVVACSLVVAVLGPSTTGNGAATTLTTLAASQPGSAKSAGSRSSTAQTTVTQLVARTIATAVDTKAVPSNLTPEPQHAGASLPASSADGCHAGFTEIAQGSCVYGDPAGKHTVVLFGDSHAQQWLPALDIAAKSQHWKVVSWTKSACSAATLTLIAPSLNRTYTECDTWRKATIARIGALAPTLVLVSQSENIAGSDVPAATFAQATVTTVKALQSAGAHRVTYIEDIPVPNNDLPGCIASHLDDATACTFDANKAYTYPDRHRAVPPALAAIDVPVVDPKPWFCTSTRCAAVVGNVLVFRNETHITVPYSQWLAPAIGATLSTGA